ncbi:MAG TPA: hypothetical protein VFZ89_07870, partial [Solirubrobacteraceae bacterium]
MGVRVVVGVVVALAWTADAHAASLPAVSSGHRPGPDALYDPPPRAAQLENVAPWTAPPLLVSSARAYRDGEFVYQDYLYDDHGAAGVRDPGDPFSPTDYLFSSKGGTLTYPTGAVYADNAADLVELRIKPLAGATALRVTFNSMLDPDRAAFTVAIGSSAAPVAWPHGAGVRSPAQLFLTVHGATAELIEAGGAARAPAPTASVDVTRRQIDVRIPHAAWNPGTSRVRLAAATGLWAGDGYARPGLAATATTPGGVSASGSGLFNVAFRYDEPMPDVSMFGAGITIADAALGSMLQARWWRDRAQADALAGGDISTYFQEVDFAKLAAKAADDSGVPKTGPLNRIFASRQVHGQGVDNARLCGGIEAAGDEPVRCTGALVGQLQPYAIYVPRKPRPARGYGLTLLLHSLGGNYNQYLDSKNQSQLGERAGGSIVVTPTGRGPDGFYHDVAEGDSFEVWGDVARHYALDPDWAVVSGYSMGGEGTWQYLSRWPDLFARGMSTVGPRGLAAGRLASLRNTPVMAWSALADELVNIAETEGTITQLTRLGVRFQAWLFPLADHLSLATNDEYGPAAAFLGDARVDRDPAHVTYVVDEDDNSERARAVADHAYWLSDLKARDAERNGTIDARSAAFGSGDAPPRPITSGLASLDGGARGPQPAAGRARTWGPAPQAPKADRLVVRATNVSRATVATARAKLSCAPTLDVQSDGPLDLRLACPPPPRSCARTLRIALPRLRGSVSVRISRR